MTRRGHFAGILLLALIATAFSAAQGRAGTVRLDRLNIPAVLAGPQGAATFALEAIVLRPDDGMPRPLAILNHGSPRNAEDRPAMNPYRMWAEGMAFARRGWVAVAFMRRGYSLSQGQPAGNFGSCANPDYAAAGRADASEIAAVAHFMTAQGH